MPHTCPVCGYPKLKSAPRSPNGGGSYEICPSCGFQFGVDDDDLGISHHQWRKNWKNSGLKWSSLSIPQPEKWRSSKMAAVEKLMKKAAKKNEG